MAARKRGRTAPTDMHELTSYYALSSHEDKKPKVAPPAPRLPALASDKAYLSALATRFMKPQAIVLDLVKSLYNPQSLPFMTKFQPKSEQEMLDKDLKSAIRGFVAGFYERHSQSDPVSGIQALVLQGPTGSGKTSAVRTMAKSLKLILMEMSTKDQRTGQALRGVIGEATQTKKVESVESHALILLDDVDVVFEGEKGFYGTVWELVRKTKFPIIMTATLLPSDLHDKSLISLHTLPPLSETEALLKLSLILKLEKIDIPETSLPALYHCFNRNMASVLNALQLKDLGLMLGLQKPVEGLETLEGRISVRSPGGNWVAENWEYGFEDWLSFVHLNQENIQTDDIDVESGLLDVLSIYDSFSQSLSHSLSLEDSPCRPTLSPFRRPSAAEHRYRLSSCSSAVESLIRARVQTSKKLIIAYSRKNTARMQEFVIPAKKPPPLTFKCKKNPSKLTIAPTLPVHSEPFLD